MIYLDNNATTATDDRVVDRLAHTLRRGPANASSSHRGGQRAAAMISDATSSLSRSLGTPLGDPGCHRFVFTSGGTEANNLAIAGIKPAHGDSPLARTPLARTPLWCSAIEHPSVLVAARAAAEAGRPVSMLDVDRRGTLRIDVLADRLARHDGPPPVVAVMSANNETGVMQPIASVAALCAEHAAHLHVDATQTIGKLPPPDWATDAGAAAIGSMTMAAHKFHGPPGVGGLVVAPGVEIDAVIRGGGQQLDSRGGTEPVALIDAMAWALALATEEMEAAARHTATMRDRLREIIVGGIGQADVVQHGGGADRLPHTLCVSLLGVDRQSLLMALDMAGVAAGSGSACSSGSNPPSHVLIAMGCDDAQLRSAVRFGVSKWTTADEIERAGEIVVRCARKLKK